MPTAVQEGTQGKLSSPKINTSEHTRDGRVQRFQPGTPCAVDARQVGYHNYFCRALVM